MPLGGQHITAALIRLRKYQMEKGVAEVDLQDSLKFLKGVVYSTSTPVKICRAVAGRHQSQQHNVKESTIAECLDYIADMGAEKLQRTGGRTSMLTDTEIFNTINTMGLVRGVDKAESKTQGELTLKEADSMDKQQVSKSTRMSS